MVIGKTDFLFGEQDPEGFLAPDLGLLDLETFTQFDSHRGKGTQQALPGIGGPADNLQWFPAPGINRTQTQLVGIGMRDNLVDPGHHDIGNHRIMLQAFNLDPAHGQCICNLGGSCIHCDKLSDPITADFHGKPLFSQAKTETEILNHFQRTV